jgi:molybdate transport system ATP-binding protein
MLERMRVAHLADRRPVTLSGGEAQRVALARAFAMAPRLLLLDEPFSALDEGLREQLQAEVRAFAAEAGLVVLQVTHRVSEARAMGERVVMLEAGRVSAEGAVASLL